MQVIGAGFARTGTLSLKVALEMIGFRPCYHMVEVFAHPEHIAVWQAAAEGKPIDWKGLFAGYRAEVDWPASIFWKDLMQVYPEAKVILTVRDPEKWFESVQETIHWALQQDGMSPVESHEEEYRHMIDTLIWRGMFDGHFEDKDYAIDLFNRNTKEVKDTVPVDRLLIFNVAEGWEPLCRFLGVEAPDMPFPRVNDRETFKQRVRGEALTDGSPA